MMAGQVDLMENWFASGKFGTSQIPHSLMAGSGMSGDIGIMYYACARDIACMFAQASLHPCWLSSEGTLLFATTDSHCSQSLLGACLCG